MKYHYSVFSLMVLLLLPAIGQTNISLEVSTKFMNFNFSSDSEDSIDEQIRRTKEYLEFLKETLPKETKKYNDYLKKHSLSPVPATENYENKIRQLEKIKELLDLKMQTKLYQERSAEFSRKEARLPYFSPNGLRNVKDLPEAIEILSTAKKLVFWGEMIPGPWVEDGFGYSEYQAGVLTISDSETIKLIYELFKNGEFKYDSESTQSWLEGAKVGTKLHFLIEVDDLAYIYILSDMLICEMQKTYIPQKFESDKNTCFMAELAMLLPLDKHLKKKSQPED